MTGWLLAPFQEAWHRILTQWECICLDLTILSRIRVEIKTTECKMRRAIEESDLCRRNQHQMIFGHLNRGWGKFYTYKSQSKNAQPEGCQRLERAGICEGLLLTIRWWKIHSS